MRDGRRVRALILMSGGLDSLLAVCLLRQQGIDVHAVVFESPFFDSGAARRASVTLDIPLRAIDFTGEIVALLHEAKHGFGSCMNPCIDCHAHMLRRAGQLMEEEGFDFLCTGEVLNERPMSQSRKSMDIVARDSGYEGKVLRPLSARLLPPTEAEKLGWVDREALGAISGRSRKPQLAMAVQYGLTDIPTPAGGCRLTEPNFCRRLQDLKEHEGLHGVRSIRLLRFGRHFRLSENLKLIVGRNEKDNAVLEGCAELYDLVLKTEDVPGPTGLLPFTAQEADVELAASICARYSDALPGERVTIRVRSPRDSRRIHALAADPAGIESLRV